MKNYTVKSPILFLIFNRPDVTKAVFEKIQMVKPTRLYIAADGPRSGYKNENDLCKETLSVIKNIDWDCEVKTLFRETNLGCKEAISSAITWFFDQEEEGIILEDDCMPAISFFYYCDTLLEKYRYDARIRHIGGCNLQLGRKWGEATFYFSHLTAVWGWASWRRVWKDYDKELKNYHEDEVRTELTKIFNDRFLIDSWEHIFREVKANKIDTWDYQYAFLNYFNNALTIHPNVNLISNIGFREDATHTTSPDHAFSNLQLEEITEITYPKYLLPERSADYAIYEHQFQLSARWQEYNHSRKSFKKRLKAFFKRSK